MADSYSIVLGPIITEKTADMGEANTYAFWVHPKANKLEIKAAIQEVFEVGVTRVNTSRLPGKMKKMGRNAGRRPLRKKAFVTLKEGDAIDVTGGSV